MTNFILTGKQAMESAWEIYRRNNNGWNFGRCLSLAWRRLKMLVALRTLKVSFSFKKVDGSTRKAKGTLSKDAAGRSLNTGKQFDECGDQLNPMLVRYWDLEKNAVRCFKIENLIEARQIVKNTWAYSWMTKEVFTL